MRVSRKLLLGQHGGFVHKYWRAHNRQFLLADWKVKELYLRHTFRALTHKSVKNEVRLHAYCVMSNHSHQMVSYKSVSQYLSHFMRIAHSSFGQQFNKLHNRLGSVACDRPKTPLVQQRDWHLMRVHFYIESNPYRAGITKNLKLYRGSSFRFYAWGIKDEFSEKLEIPSWYIELGKTSAARQSRYRQLFEEYLKETRGKVSAPELFRENFYGDLSWKQEKRQLLRRELLATRAAVSGVPPPS